MASSVNVEVEIGRLTRAVSTRRFRQYGDAHRKRMIA
jgi:hypothetical protein